MARSSRRADVSAVVVGTTIGINAVLTRTGARVVYLTTKGFEDIPFIQRINRKYHYDFTWRKPMPLVERPDCVGVVERLDEEGEVEVELDAEALRESLAELAPGAAPTAVAVCTLFSYLNPEHELRAREMWSRTRSRAFRCRCRTTSRRSGASTSGAIRRSSTRT